MGLVVALVAAIQLDQNRHVPVRTLIQPKDDLLVVRAVVFVVAMRQFHFAALCLPPLISACKRDGRGVIVHDARIHLVQGYCPGAQAGQQFVTVAGIDGIQSGAQPLVIVLACFGSKLAKPI